MNKRTGLIGTKIIFPNISVGATENALLAAFYAKGETIIKNAAIEPEVKDLIKFLNKLGGKIRMSGRTIFVNRCKDINTNLVHENDSFRKKSYKSWSQDGIFCRI